MKKRYKLTKSNENRFLEYCDFEEKAVLKKDQVLSILELLKINTTIRNLIRTGTIESIYKNQLYKIKNRNITIEKLLSLIFDPDDKYYLSGIAIYNNYGFINQLPSKYQVINTRISGEKKISGFNIIFSKKKRTIITELMKKKRSPQ